LQNKHLFAGLGIELSNRRRNKFAGWVESVKIENEHLLIEARINAALGNCPKYINIRDLKPKTPTQSKILAQNLSCSSDEPLPEQLLQHLRIADSMYLATAYLPTDVEDAHLGVNHRGGKPGFLRVHPEKKNVVYLPDFSGNRMMQSMGNMQSYPFAGFTVPDWKTGSILYLTGQVRQYLGRSQDASKIMRSVHGVTELSVTGYTFVQNALPLVESTDTSFSPYNPPLRFLNIEAENGTALSNGPLQADILAFELHSESLATVTFKIKDCPKEIQYSPGKYVILDCSAFLAPESQAYSHMRRYVGGEMELNDDGIRSWTITSWSTSSDKSAQFSITIRKKENGHITPILFAFGTAVNSRNDGKFEGPAALSFPLLGVAGSFKIETSKPAIFFASGIGITPLLSHLRSLTSDMSAPTLILSCRKEEVEPFEKLVVEASPDQQELEVMVLISNISTQDLASLAESKLSGSKRVAYRLNANSCKQELEISDLHNKAIYLCGSESYKTVVLAGLENVGVDVSQVRDESFAF